MEVNYICKMFEEIEKVKAEIESFKIENQKALENFRLAFLAKKGVITDLMSGLKDALPEDRKNLGQVLNDLKNFAWEKFERVQSNLTS